jgi:hypothetical protein
MNSKGVEGSYDLAAKSHGAGLLESCDKVWTSHDAGLESGDTKLKSGSEDVCVPMSSLQCTANWPVGSHDTESHDVELKSHSTGPGLTNNAKSAPKSDGKKRNRHSTLKRVKPVTSTLLPDEDPGLAQHFQKSISKETVPRRVIAGKPCLVSTSKFVPKTKLILHTQTSKLVSPRGMYWAKERDRISSLDHTQS